jgi:parvulin-like peptidyl-prolyl isomerase
VILPRLVVAAAVVSLANGAAAPAGAADDAASVNGVNITVDQFENFSTSLADAGLTQFAPTAGSRTLDAEAGRTLLTVLMMNEARAQFLAEMGEDAVTESEIDEFYADLAEDHPLQALMGDERAAVASDSLYATRLDTIEVTDVETLRERYETAPASLGVYCATATVVADRDDAEEVADALRSEEASWDAVSSIAGAAPSDWECTPLSTVTDPNLFDELVAAEPGDVIGPVRTSDGYAVLVIDEFDDAAPKLESFVLRLQDGGNTSVGFVLYQGFLATSEITVSPRFGRWDALTASIVTLGG